MITTQQYIDITRCSSESTLYLSFTPQEMEEFLNKKGYDVIICEVTVPTYINSNDNHVGDLVKIVRTRILAVPKGSTPPTEWDGPYEYEKSIQYDFVTVFRNEIKKSLLNS